jgi:hypothetical protein
MPTISIAVDQNPDYLFYLPITSYVNRHFGFATHCFVVGESRLSEISVRYAVDYSSTEIYSLRPNSPYRSETLAQFSRLYAACLIHDDEYIITGDVDMIPLSDYLHRDFDNRNLFGKDLTNGHMYPMCYAGMTSRKWREFLDLEAADPIPYIERDLASIAEKALSKEFSDYWYVDQRFLTDKVIQFGENHFNSIERGRDKSGLARGRIDRAHWQWEKTAKYIDCHMLRNSYSDEAFMHTYDLISFTLKQEIPWMREYHEQFKQILKAIE